MLKSSRMMDSDLELKIKKYDPKLIVYKIRRFAFNLKLGYKCEDVYFESAE